MRRVTFALLACLGLALLPGKASATYPCWCPPLPVCGWSYGPVPVIVVPVYVPTPVAAAPAVSAAPVPVSPKTQLSKPLPLTTETTPTTKLPTKQPVRPAGFDDMPKVPSVPKVEPFEAVVPVPVPSPKKSEPVNPETLRIPPPSTPVNVEPTPTPKAPAVEPVPEFRASPPTPKAPAVEPMPEFRVSPPSVAPAPPAMTPSTPVPLTLPESPKAAPSVPSTPVPLTLPESPKTPASSVPEPLILPEMPKDSPKSSTPELVLPPLSATPAPAPAPTEPEFVPSDAPKLPLPPGKGGSDTGLPPLVLPPVAAPSVSQASPLASLPRVRMIPVASTTQAPPAGKRKVGVFNYTNRELDLVIDGEKVTMPKRSYLHAEAPATFVWRIAGGTPRTVTIPAGQVGVEMMIE